MARRDADEKASVEMTSAKATCDACEGLMADFRAIQEQLQQVSLPAEVRELLKDLGGSIKAVADCANAMPGARMSTQEQSPHAMGLEKE